MKYNSRLQVSAHAQKALAYPPVKMLRVLSENQYQKQRKISDTKICLTAGSSIVAKPAAVVPSQAPY